MGRFDWGRLDPRFWLQNEPTNWEWDTILNDLLDHHEPKLGYLTVTLGNVEVWVSNWPYAYGSPHSPEANVLPSTATRKRLRAVVPKKDPLAKLRAVLP